MAYYGQGTYDCQITGQGMAESKEKKTPYFFLRFLPISLNGEKIHEDQEREVALWLTEKTIDRSIEVLRQLGWNGDSFKELEPGGGVILKGLHCKIRCEHEQVDANVWERWQFPFAGQATEHKAGLSKKLDALFGKSLKKTAGTAKPVAKPEPAEVATEVAGDDEIPF